ncbi:MAG: Gp49 family protein [Candidatus Ferrigenium altingense]
MRNGFTVTGRKIARQNAVSKVWPLMGYALRSKLSQNPKKRTCNAQSGQS